MTAIEEEYTTLQGNVRRKHIEHGTEKGWRMCRLRAQGVCDSCRTARRMYNAAAHGRQDRRGTPGNQLLLVQCWCRTNYVWVHQNDVLNMRTDSCNREGCNSPRNVGA